MIPEYPITPEELAGANVLTAPEMGFMLDSGARQIHESRGTLAEMLMRGHKVKIILAKNNGTPNTHLGIFYHNKQSAATSAHALCHYLNGEVSIFPELAKRNTELCYGSRTSLIQAQQPIIAGTQLIGGGKIHLDENQDTAGSLTLRTNFALPDIPRAYMQIVRRLVLEKL